MVAPPSRSVCLRLTLTILPVAALLMAGAGTGASERALVVVKTLVIDGMGTRTVDTDSARIPFGGRGLMIKKVPYAGPSLSFRLGVLAGEPQEGGIPLTLTAEIWSGDTTTSPPPESLSRREEATMVAAETSYLFEIDHDPKTDRRIVLSVSARPIPEDEILPGGTFEQGGPIQFLMEVTKERAGAPPEPEVHLLSSMVGRAVTYSSGVKVPAPPGASAQMIGLSVTMTAERVQGSLVTVKVELTGLEYVDEARSRIESINRTEFHTVTSGSRVDVQVTVPPPDPTNTRPDPALRPVTYRVSVIPTLG